MGYCGIPWEYIKPNSSSNRKRTNASLIKTVQKDMQSKYFEDLKSYKSACREDSYLNSFNSSFKERTKRFTKSLGSHADAPSLSLDSLSQVYAYLFDLNQDAVNVIIENKEEVRKNKDVRSLVEAYFNNNSKTLDLCNTVQKCVKETENGQRNIQLAVTQFETESVDTDLGETCKKKALEELNKFKAMGDPFVGEFEIQYKSVYDQQVLLLEELRKQREKLDKKERNAKIWKILSNVVFITSFASAFVVSVVLAVIGASAVTTAVVSGCTAPFVEVMKLLRNMSKENEKVVKRQKGLVLQIESGAKANKMAAESIEKEVDKLGILFLETVEEEEDEVKIGIAMEKLKKEVDGFTEKIKEIGEYADKYSKLISHGRLLVLEHNLLPANDV